MNYRRLDEKEDEIRVLCFPTQFSLPSDSEQISYTLQHVSLKLHHDDNRNIRDSPPLDQVTTPKSDEFTQPVDFRDDILERNAGGEIRLCASSSLHRNSKAHRYSWGDFEALSYTWGGEAGEGEIILDQTITKVPKNLEAALRALRSLPETQKNMRFWVDYLCINQNDVSEKEHQIKLMGHIYRSARAVVVWLGHATTEDNEAVRAMQRLIRDEKKLPQHRPVNWSALCKLMNKTYWSRTWIIQELALNHESTLFMCGTWRFTREMVRKGAQYCQIHLLKKCPLDTPKYEEMRAMCVRVQNTMLLEYKPHCERNTDDLLSLVRKADVTNAHDKVFGILGLLDQKISENITLGYDRSVQQVYTDLTISLIQNTGSLEEILFGGSQREEWQSWVPDLREPFKRHHVRKLRNCKAAGALRGKFRFEMNNGGSTLICHGYCIDVIDGTGACHGRNMSITQSEFTHSRYGRLATEALAETLIISHPRAKEGHSVLNIPWKQIQDIPWKKIYRMRDYRTFHKFCEANKDLRIGGKSFQDFFLTSEPPDMKLKDLRHNLHLAVVSLVERVITTTKTGYVCLAPADTLRGDLVVILPACNCPVILRRFGMHYKIIGECYVHGIMLGEAVKPGFESEYPVQEFRLH